MSKEDGCALVFGKCILRVDKEFSNSQTTVTLTNGDYETEAYLLNDDNIGYTQTTMRNDDFIINSSHITFPYVMLDDNEYKIIIDYCRHKGHVLTIDVFDKTNNIVDKYIVDKVYTPIRLRKVMSKNSDLRQTALVLKENCKKRTTCRGCAFNSSGVQLQCDISFSHFDGEKAALPREWEVD